MNQKILEIALSQYGVSEITGKNDNPIIVGYSNAVDNMRVQDDETSWCSSFANWVCKQAGFERSNRLDARSWLKVGESVTEPEIGDIVVFWRENKDGWKGHVAFYINKDSNYIWVLGGNQSNMVKIAAYPKERLLGFRRLK